MPHKGARQQGKQDEDCRYPCGKTWQSIGDALELGEIKWVGHCAVSVAGRMADHHSLPSHHDLRGPAFDLREVAVQHTYEQQGWGGACRCKEDQPIPPMQRAGPLL